MHKLRNIMLSLMLVIASIFVAVNTFTPDVVKTVEAAPIAYESRPTNQTFSSGVLATIPMRAYDNSNATYAEWAYTRGYAQYGTSDGYLELNVYGPRMGEPRGSHITRVDLKVSYRVLLQSTVDATMKLSYFVSPSAAEQPLRGPIREAVGWYNLTYTNQPDPNVGAEWSWEDITNLKFRFTRIDPTPASVDTGGLMKIVEVWAVVYYEFSQVVAVSPKVQSPIPSTVKLNVTGIEELYGFEFILTYNTTAITVTGVTLGPLLNNTAGAGNTFGYKVQLDDATGVVWFTQTIRGNYRGAHVAGGTWETLATINIATDAGGPSNLDFEIKLAGLNYALKKTYPLTFTLIQPGHDIAVTEVTAAPTNVTRGETVGINVTVQNHGDYVETFNVTIYAGGTAINTTQVSGLGLGATRKISYSWDTRPFLAGNYLITAQAVTQTGIMDVDTADNTGTGPTVTTNPIFGDIAANGWIDEGDLSMLNAAFGSQPGDFNWSYDCDLNRNSIVDVEDLRLLGRAWYPPP